MVHERILLNRRKTLHQVIYAAAFFFSLFPLDGAIPVSLGSYVFHSTALCSSDTKQDFLLSIRIAYGYLVSKLSDFELVLLKVFLCSKITTYSNNKLLSHL